MTDCAGFFTAKLVEVGYGIKKLQIMMTIEDDKVGVEELNEQIVEDLADYVSASSPSACQS